MVSCFPPIWVICIGAAEFYILHPHKSPGMWFVVICPLSLGIIIAFFCARRVKNSLASGNHEYATKISNKSKRGFLVALIAVWAIGIYWFIAAPAFSAFTVRAMNYSAGRTLEELAEAQDTYYEKNKKYTP